jgi:hypothetical protein
VSSRNVSSISACLQDAQFSESALKCLECLSHLSCNDRNLGHILPIICDIASSSANEAVSLRLIGNLVANDCNDAQALQCGLAQRVMSILERTLLQQPINCVILCPGIRILSSLSSSPTFDAVFCSSSITKVGLP